MSWPAERRAFVYSEAKRVIQGRRRLLCLGGLKKERVLSRSRPLLLRALHGRCEEVCRPLRHEKMLTWPNIFHKERNRAFRGRVQGFCIRNTMHSRLRGRPLASTSSAYLVAAATNALRFSCRTEVRIAMETSIGPTSSMRSQRARESGLPNMMVFAKLAPSMNIGQVEA